MQSETGFPSSHQLKSYVASKSRLKLAACAVLSADAGLLVIVPNDYPSWTSAANSRPYTFPGYGTYFYPQRYYQVSEGEKLGLCWGQMVHNEIAIFYHSIQ